MQTRFGLLIVTLGAAVAAAQPPAQAPARQPSVRVLHAEPDRLAGRDTTIRIDTAAWREYTVQAEIRFEHPGAAFRLDAGGELEVTPDAADTKFDLRVAHGGNTLASETELLKPLPQKGWGAGVEQEIEREARAMPGWKGRWFPVRAEVSARSVWFYFDGRAIAEVPQPGALESIRLHLPAGAAIRGQRVTKANWSPGGYLPVDLKGYYNSEVSQARINRTGELLRVGGVPFLQDGRAVDVSQAGLRLRKKPSGPGSLYGNPFNSISAMDGDPLTILLRVPKRYYRRAWLLAAADDSAQLRGKLTVRLARYRGASGVFFADSEVTVPRRSDSPRPGMPPSLPAETGRLWLVEVPLDPGALQDILAADFLAGKGNPSEVLKLDAGTRWLEIELTRELRADLNCMLPLGPPSGVRVYGVTLEESPVKMVVTSETAGHVFEAGETPRFDVWLENVTGAARAAALNISTRGYDPAKSAKTERIALAAGEKTSRRIALPQDKLGKYAASFELVDARGARLVKRDTTFAILPPDTRRAERDSPFGLWSWGGAHLTPPNEVEAALMRKAGARFTLGANYPSKHKYGIGTATDCVTGVYYSSQPITGEPVTAAREMVAKMRTRGSDPLYWQIYWEDAISDRHNRVFPPSLIGRPPLVLNQPEQARFQAYWDRAEAYARMVRRELPQEKLALGAFANFTEEFLRRGFPKKYLDAISLEVSGFRMQPERPPAVDDVHGLYFITEWKKLYGYQDLETIMVESLFHGTAPGYLSERDQANYYVRDFLLSLAYGVKLFGMSAMITDVADDYYRSTWGSVGLCHRAPEPSPKEAYAAYATMTSVLDRARYGDYLDTGSPSVYALRFDASDGENVYALWTTRGRRDVAPRFSGAAGAVVIDPMHNRRPLTAARLTLTEAPLYLKAKARIIGLELGTPVYPERPPVGAARVDALNDLAAWQPKTDRDPLLEDGNSRYPRRPGNFAFKVVRDPVRGKVLEVAAQAAAGPPLLPMYDVLERRSARAIPGAPRRLGLWVRGNSGWGRITFELVDAQGESWIGVGGSEDSYGHGFVNFDGWRWVEVDLPGHFRKDYPWPNYSNWTSRGGDGLVDYPLAFSKVIVELRDQVVYVNKLVPVPNRRIALSDLTAIY